MSLQAELAATLVDEWWRAGVRQAVICPGSRSAPLALALLRDGRLRVHVRLDERSAGFFALGAALASGAPVVVAVTSGTAAGELHAAVMEADLAGVPLVVCTADRPPELHGVGAPQTVDQVGVFGGAVRFSWSPGVLDAASRASWRSYASRLVAEASSGPRGPGPVHANLAFREPLAAGPGELPPGRPEGRPWHELVREPAAPRAAVERFVALLEGAERGVLVAGAGAAGALGAAGRDAVVGLATRLGWPVLSEPRAWPREPLGGAAAVVHAADQILRSGRAREALGADLVVHLGTPPASKVVGTWCASLAASGAAQVHVEASGRIHDPDRAFSALLVADPGMLAAGALEALVGAAPPRPAGAWAGAWAAAEEAAQAAIDAVLAEGEAGGALGEPWLARALHDALPSGSCLVASSSMPVRQLEWFARPRPGAPRLLANRGANGIDGVVSTVLGVASAHRGGPTVGLLGDLAFLHDLSGLVWGAAEEVPRATLVVVDNAGGEIFSFLPYAPALDGPLLERAFTTPQRHDPAEVAAGLGWRVRHVTSRAELTAAAGAAGAGEGIEVLVAKTDRGATLEVHRALEEAVARGVERALGLGG